LTDVAIRMYSYGEHELHCRVALVEGTRDETGVTVEAERELRHVVGPDGETVEVVEELVGQHRVRRQLAHHDHLQPVFTAWQVVAGE
jgi:hypothetical protein